MLKRLSQRQDLIRSSSRTSEFMKKLALVAAVLFPLIAQAQNYSIDWSKISGGGGTSSGGNYSLSGTIGQHDAGQMSGGNFTLDGGFWSLASVVQTPGSPLLTLTVSGNSYILSWPAASTGFRLEVNSNLGNTNSWGTVPQGQSTNSGVISVTVPASAGNNFFRLKNP